MNIFHLQTKQQGAVLFILLFVWQLIMLLVFYQYQHIASEIILTKREYQAIVFRLYSKSLLKKLMSTISPCQIKPTPISILLTIPFAKWSKFACIGRSPKYKYYYFSEDLGIDPCGMIKAAKNIEKKVVNYLRYTLVVEYVPTKHSATSLQRVILQSTLTRPSNIILPCTKSIHFVKVGQQMVREI